MGARLQSALHRLRTRFSRRRQPATQTRLKLQVDDLQGHQLRAVVLHWSLMLTLAIGCVIVMLMKGPAYVADAYPPPGRDGVC